MGGGGHRHLLRAAAALLALEQRHARLEEAAAARRLVRRRELLGDPPAQQRDRHRERVVAAARAGGRGAAAGVGRLGRLWCGRRRLRLCCGRRRGLRRGRRRRLGGGVARGGGGVGVALLRHRAPLGDVEEREALLARAAHEPVRARLARAVLAQEAEDGDGAVGDRRRREAVAEAAGRRQLLGGHDAVALDDAVLLEAEGDVGGVGHDVVEPVVEADERGRRRVLVVQLHREARRVVPVARARRVERRAPLRVLAAVDDRVRAQQQREVVELPAQHAAETARRPPRRHPLLALVVVAVVVAVGAVAVAEVERRRRGAAAARRAVGAERVRQKVVVDRLARELQRRGGRGRRRAGAGSRGRRCVRVVELEALEHERVADAVHRERDGALVVQQLEEGLHVLRRRDEVDAVALLRERGGAQLGQQPQRVDLVGERAQRCVLRVVVPAALARRPPRERQVRLRRQPQEVGEAVRVVREPRRREEVFWCRGRRHGGRRRQLECCTRRQTAKEELGAQQLGRAEQSGGGAVGGVVVRGRGDAAVVC